MNNASFVSSFTGEGAAGVASLDPPLIQQTKSEIRTLASEIAKLAHGAIEPAEFYRGFLPRLVTAMGAEGAAVWQTCESLRNYGTTDSIEMPEQGMRLLAQHCIADELLDRSDLTKGSLIPPSESHRRILECVISEGTPILVPPQAVSIDADRPNNPIEDSIIIVPVRIEDDVEYVLEVVQQASGGPAAQRGYLRFVAQMADLMADYLRRQSLREHSSRAAQLQQFEYWLSTIAQAATPSSQLRIAADGLADLLESDQVFVLRSGRRPKVLAASGLETFDPRSETIMAAQLAERFLQRESVSQEAFLDLQPWKSGDEHLTSVSRLFELMGTEKLVRLRVSETSEVVAMLALPVDSQASSSQMLRVASSLLGLVDLHGARSSFLRRWFPFQSSPRITSKSNLSTWQLWTKRLVIAGIVIAIAAFPVPQQISTTAVLAPTKKNCYYASNDATVKKVFDTARDKGRVKKGDVLLELESVALNQRRNAIMAEQALINPRLENLKYLKNAQGGRTGEGFSSSSAEFEQIEIREKTNKLEQKLLDLELQKLTIVALEDGEITSWDIANRLQGRPVARGELLLSTCDPATDWELQVSVPEHRVGLVSDALTRSEKGTVPIRFLLTSHPNVPMEGGLTWMADQATRNASGSNVVLSRAAVFGELPLKKEGAIARVTIDCGHVPAIWLIVRDAYWACMSRLKMIW